MKNILLLCTLFLLSCTTNIAQNTDPALSKLMQLSYHEIDSLSMFFYEKGDYGSAIPYMQVGREKSKKEFGTQDSIYAAYVINLGTIYYMLGQFELAEPLFKETVNIQEKIMGKTHPSYAESLNNLAALYQNMGQYEQALLLFIESKNIRAKLLGMEHPEYAESLNNLAALYQEIGQYEQALPLYLEAKNISAKSLGMEHPGYAMSLNNLANLYEQMEEYEQALPIYMQAKNIYAKSLGIVHPSYALSLSNLASLYRSMEQYEQALPLFIESKKIRAKVLGIEHPSYALSLNNLAHLYIEMQQYEQALPLLLQAKNIYAKSLGMEHIEYGNSLINLADLYGKMGQYEQAWEATKATITVFSKLQLHNELNSAWADSLRRVDYSSNEHLEKMIETLELVYNLLILDSHKRGDEKDNNAASKSSQIIVSDLAAALLIQLRDKHSNNDDKLRMLAQSSNWLLKSLKVLDKNKDANKAFEKADQNKSVLLLEAAKSEKAYQLGNLPDSLVRKEQGLIAKRDKLQANLLEQRPESEKDSLRAVLNTVHQDLSSFVATIEKNYPKYAAFKYHQVDAKTADIQKLLDDHSALLEYVIGDSVLYIFYVDKNGLRWVEKALDTKELAAKIKILHGVLSNYELLAKKSGESYQLYTETAHWFYQNLIAPVMLNQGQKPVLSNAKRVQQLIIVTDGELGHLPFEAFLVEAAPQKETDYSKLHYLVNDFSISYNYSATLFVESQLGLGWKENKEAPKPQNNGQVFAFASNYEIPLDVSTNKVRLPTYLDMRKMLNPLPEARKEVEFLSQNYSGFFAFDKEASEKIFKEKAGDYAIIHLAMHGLLDSKRPVLSSLAFTEDGDSLENNFLQAYEISKLNLNADLVILSACETGYGKFEKGNGIASLARAFMFAGASSLVVSLWQVNDFATSELMKYFYANLANGMDKAVALQEAKLEYIKNAKGIAAHPAFWSPFIQIGNSRPLTLVRTHVFAPAWAIGTGIILLIAAVFFIRKRKIKV